MDQNTQFIITVGTVIGVFLWLRHDINQLNSRVDTLNAKFDKMNDNYAVLRETLGWIRGRMGFSEQLPSDSDQ